MKCEICNENDVSGVIHLDGKELYVCKACAQKSTGSGNRPKKKRTGKPIDLPGNFKGNIQIHGGQPPPAVMDAIIKATMDFVEGISKLDDRGGKIPDGPDQCPCCGTTWKDIDEKDLMGCPRCYKTFAARLRAVKLRWQYGLFHAGNRAGEEKPGVSEIESLKKELAMAVKKEEYELAAEIRRKIDALTGKAGGEKND